MLTSFVRLSIGTLMSQETSALSGEQKKPPPGNRARQLARCGALLCTVATFYPWDDQKSMWRLVGDIVETAWDSNDDAWIRVFCCLGASVLLGGPVYLYACRPLQRDVTRFRSHLILGLWGISTAASYVFGVRQLPPRSAETETTIAIAISALSLYLLFSALLFLQSRYRRHTPLEMFPMGAFMPVLMLGSWMCFSVGILIQTSLSNAEITASMCVVSLAGITGSVMLLIGWLLWWRALANDQPKPAAAVALPN